MRFLFNQIIIRDVLKIQNFSTSLYPFIRGNLFYGNFLSVDNIDALL